MDTEWEDWVNKHNLKFWNNNSTTNTNSNEMTTESSQTHDKVHEDLQKEESHSMETLTGKYDQIQQHENNHSPLLPGIDCDTLHTTFDDFDTSSTMEEAQAAITDSFIANDVEDYCYGGQAEELNACKQVKVT